MFRNTKKFEKAYEYYVKYSQLNDSLFSEKSMKTINDLEVKYETAKIESENLKLKSEAEIKDWQLKQRSTMLIGSTLIVVLVLIVLIVLYLRINTKNELNKLLSEKNSQLEVLNATKDKFFSIISHDLKNPVSAFRNVTSALYENIEEVSKGDIKYYVEELSTASANLFQMLQSLLQWARVQTGKITCMPTEIDLTTTIRQVIDVFSLSISEKQLCVDLDISLKMKVRADKEMLQTVLRNLVSNAIKFTPKEGNIQISTQRINDIVEVSVSDSGIGMSHEDVNKLFKINIDTKIIGNSPEKGTGLGLIICDEMIRKCGGKIIAESEPDQGTKFVFSIPVN